FLWGWPDFKTLLNGGSPDNPNLLAGRSKLSYQVSGLDKVVYRTAPVAIVPEGLDHAAEAEKAVYDFNWLSATGTGIFLASLLSSVWLGVRPTIFLRLFADTVWRMRWALLTIACMLALAFVTKYSGSDATLGLAFTKTG